MKKNNKNKQEKKAIYINNLQEKMLFDHSDLGKTGVLPNSYKQEVY